MTTSAGPRRIGVFGGSFDPVHNAHLALAHSALASLALDELLWLPAGQPWQKARALAPAPHRAAMVSLAIADEPRFVRDTRELERSGPSYTIDTMRALQAEQPLAHWVLLIGQDQYAALHSWRGWEELLQSTELAVANRPGSPLAADPRVQQMARLQSIPLPPMDVSSTKIRACVSSGQGIDGLVPAAVARYIEQHDLYRGTLRS